MGCHRFFFWLLLLMLLCLLLRSFWDQHNSYGVYVIVQMKQLSFTFSNHIHGCRTVVYIYMIRYDMICLRALFYYVFLCFMPYVLCLLLLSAVINKLHFFAVACCFKLKPFNDDMMMMFSPFVDFSQQGYIVCYDRTLTHLLTHSLTIWRRLAIWDVTVLF